MVDVIAILGLSVAVVVLVWLATCGTTCRPPWKCCRRRNQAQDVVTIQVDLRSGEVRTCTNSLSAAFSQSPLHITQVSRLSQQGMQDEEKVTPGTPTRTHTSLTTTATQTRFSSPSILSTTASEYSSEVAPLDKSMWESLSPSTSPTSTERSLSNTSGYINTTYFEEATQATRELLHSPASLSIREAPKAGVLIELERLDGRTSSSSLPFTSGSSDDSSLTRSTSTLLAKSESCIFPDLLDSGVSPCPPCLDTDENKENIDPDENKENIDPNAIRPSCSGVALNPELPERTLKQTPERAPEPTTSLKMDGERQNLLPRSVECEAGPLPDSQQDPQPDSSTSPTTPASPASPAAKEEEEDAPVPDSDIESYHTCEDNASDMEEDTNTKETIDLENDCDVLGVLSE
ncbi:hypothetical protein E2C01_001991 [Portunus trituberculatus]|uniref:Flocculation protein FLO11-like n=1 Tax=Portunus trituberculatus TaxID=210409 RepID=A0A5B7CKQ9_PORTR|nr:hypothetical protein [Portunus trituberculatus]